MDAADSLFTFQTLATLGGAATLVFLVVQLTKFELDKHIYIPTAIYATMVAFVVVLAAQIGTGADYKDWRTYFLSAANAFLVSATAGKMRDSVLQEQEKRDLAKLGKK